MAAPVIAACDPPSEPDRSDIANARAAVAANCDCAGATRHGEYVRCAVQQIDAVLVNRSCRGRAKACAAKSACGRPGFVTCCRTRNDRTKCQTARSAAACEAKGGTASTCSSCCDACPAPGSGPSCPSGDLDQCCLRTVTCGPFEVCEPMTRTECVDAGGFDVGPGDCGGPAPCANATTTMPPAACCVGDQCVFAGWCECEELLGGRFMPLQGCSPSLCATNTP
jgi:hypothetical protein